MRIIVTEKPSIAARLAPFLAERWPDNDTLLVCSIPYGNIRFRYPRGMSWRDFPCVSEPRYGLAAWEYWRPQRLAPDGRLTPEAIDTTAFRNAHEIVFANDPDATGAVSFAILLEHLDLGAKLATAPALCVMDLSDKGIRRALDGVASFRPAFDGPLAAGRVKRYFDWNWNVNALAIFGEALRACGIDTQKAPPLSKYGLQLLYFLADAPKEEAMLTSRLFDHMEHWHGTGKYAAAGAERLGSVASFAAILENLSTTGLLTKTPSRPVKLTPTGRTLLSRLHPDCRDQDLPFRLAEWGARGLDDARPAIDRYIRTYFGKQMRFERDTLQPS